MIKKKARLKKENTNLDIQENKEAEDDDFRVIGIGASAGGLEALKELLSNVPPKWNHSFVIVQHLAPDYKSLMPEILARSINLSIYEVVNNMKIEKRSVYLIPPNSNMSYLKGKLMLINRPANHGLNFPIDIFFQSLGNNLKTKAIGVILSGTGTDGSRGVRTIKESGGMVMVQSPSTSKFDGMPNTAISTGTADFILSPEQMPFELENFIRNPKDSSSNNIDQILYDDKTILKIFQYLNVKTNLDFSGYKRPTLTRRLLKRMQSKNFESLEEYYDFLKKTDHEAKALCSQFMIGVTQFFRDPKAYDILEEILLRRLTSLNDSERFKVWCIGCSTGEEAYSIGIVLCEIFGKLNKKGDLKIFATDIDEDSLKIASRGIYPELIEENIPKERIDKFFVKKGNKYQVSPKLRNQIIFSQHDVLKKTPFSKMDLIVCRNMLIYFDSKIQQAVFEKIHFSLKTNGLLFLGPSESIGKRKELFGTIDNKWNIFKNKERKINVLGQLDGNSSQELYLYDNKSLVSGESFSTEGDNFCLKLLNQTLFEEQNLAALFVDRNFTILNALGSFKRYIDLPPNNFSINLLKMLPEKMAVMVGTLVKKAIKVGDGVHNQVIKINDQKGLREIGVRVKPLDAEVGGLDCFLIIFTEETKEEIPSLIGSGEIDNKQEEKIKLRFLEMEEELLKTKKDLLATIDESEKINDKLQLINQELNSSNQELQSTNEELQSINEELYTVNSEHQLKIDELTELNSDMENFIRSTNIATIFLDKEISIRKFTPNITEQFNLRETDVGRSITHFTSSFGHNDFEEFILSIKKVLETGLSDQKEIQTKNKTWYLQRIYPFMDSYKEINGVVITFVNISNFKEANERVNSLSKDLENKINELEESNNILKRLNNVAIGREERIMELKQMLNKAYERLGEAPKFDLEFMNN